MWISAKKVFIYLLNSVKNYRDSLVTIIKITKTKRLLTNKIAHQNHHNYQLDLLRAGKIDYQEC